jgi:hypothetical protein
MRRGGVQHEAWETREALVGCAAEARGAGACGARLVRCARARHEVQGRTTRGGRHRGAHHEAGGARAGGVRQVCPVQMDGRPDRSIIIGQKMIM